MAAPAGSNTHYATLFLPPREQRAWLAAHALAEDLRRIIGSTRDPGVANLRLRWWVEQINHIRKSDHPIAAELAPLLIQGHMPKELPLALIRQAEEHITPRRSATLTDNYAAHGQLWRWSASLSGPLTDEQDDAAPRLGRLLELLRDLQDLRPLSLLERSPIPGAAAEDLDLEPVIAGIDKGLTECGSGLARADKANPCLTACLVAQRLWLTTAREIARDGCHLTRRRVALTPIRKLWITAKTAVFP